MPTTQERWNSLSDSNVPSLMERFSEAASTTSSALASFARSASLLSGPLTSVADGLRSLSSNTKQGMVRNSLISEQGISNNLAGTYGGQWSVQFLHDVDCYELAYQREHRIVRVRITRFEMVEHGDPIGLLKEQAWRLFQMINEEDAAELSRPADAPPVVKQRTTPFKKAPRRRGQR
jgi:hypothetical protein